MERVHDVTPAALAKASAFQIFIPQAASVPLIPAKRNGRSVASSVSS